jgi:hypothetical protein
LGLTIDLSSQHRYGGQYLSKRSSWRLETSPQPQRRHLRTSSSSHLKSSLTVVLIFGTESVWSVE